MAGIIVQKYGGSSVADLERLGRVADKVLETHRAGHRVVVVVSAMGKTTDGLLAQARQVDPSPPRRELDMLVSTGERVSMALLSIAIQQRGAESISFTGSQAGIITTDRHFDARIVAVRPHRLLEELEKNKIVIVAGYQGVSEKKEITTLGRGGSDTTAVTLAAALNAERCEIYSDVDGVYTADPRVVPDAEHIPVLDYETLQTMAETGAKVLNAQAVEWAKRAGIEIHARHTGQSYSGASANEGSKQTVVRSLQPNERASAAVSGERGLVLVSLHSTSALAAFGEACAAAEVSPRELTLDPSGGLTALFSLLNSPDWSRAEGVLRERLPEATFRSGLAAATAVGDGLTGIAGPLAPGNLAKIASGSIAAIVGPLRATVLCEEPALDALVRAMHEAVIPR